MTTMEVTRINWEKFCQRITEACRGAMVTIQSVDANGVTNVVAEDLALQNVTLDDKSDPCNDLLIIEAGSNPENRIQYTVMEPIHIRLKNGQNDRYNRLQILGENGTCILTLRPGVTPALLEGLDHN